MTSYSVVDTDAHYLEALPELAEYVDEPWRTRLTSGGETEGNMADLFPSSSGDRAVHGRIRRDDLSWPDTTSKEDIPVMMDHLGVDKTLMISQIVLSFARIEGDDERPIVLSEGFTQYMLEEIVDPDEGIYTMVPVPYQDPDYAVDLIERVADEPGIVGALMVTAGAEPPLGNRQYEPVYRAAAEKDLTICYHTSGAGIDNYHTKGYEKLIETHTLGFLEGNMSQLVSLVCQGIPEKFPDLDVTFQESGIFWVPMIMHRLDEEYLKRPSEAPVLTRRPSEYIKEMYFGTQPFEASGDPKHLEYTIEMLGGADRLMYASDWPHWDFDRPTTITDVEFLSQEEKQKILADNAREVFGL